MKRLFGVCLLLFLFLAGCGGIEQSETANNLKGNEQSENLTLSEKQKGILQVHFLDVGQGDSALILGPTGEAALIDGGNREDGQAIVNYLKEHGVRELSLVISTHPHEDHIGGLKEVLEAFPVKQIIDSGVPHTSKTYENYLLTIDKLNIPFNIAAPGETFSLGKEVFLQVLGPINRKRDELNNMSVVLRLTYGQTVFLFMGDAEADEEKDLLKAYSANGLLQANILKVAHHGSFSSTSWEFLKAVHPQEAVISVGAGNDYGHPHEETLQRLEKAGIKIRRTDVEGTIRFGSDGTDYFSIP